MTAIILKTFKFAPELSFHLYCTEKFKNPFPDTCINQGSLAIWNSVY